jgi:hypothetical protein
MGEYVSGWTNPNVQQVVPLFSSGSLSASSNIGTIAPSSGLQIFNLLNVSQFQSYDLNLYAYAVTPGASGSPIVMLVQLLWFDDLVSGIPVFEEQWWIWVGRAAASFSDNMVATGPMHGQYMTVNLTIPTSATTNATLQYCNIFGSPRPQQWSDWRQDAFEVNPDASGITIVSPGTASYENQLVSVPNTAIGAGATVWVPIGLYAGQAYYRFQASAAPQNAVCIVSAENLVAQQIIAGTGVAGPIVSSGPGEDANDHEGLIVLPRSVCFIAVHGNATASSFSFSIEGTQTQ